MIPELPGRRGFINGFMFKYLVLNFVVLVGKERIKPGAVRVFRLYLIGFEIPMIFRQHNSGSDIANFAVFNDAKVNWGCALFLFNFSLR